MKRDEALNILETFLTDEEQSRLKRVSDMTGAPISTLIRIAVADYLKSLPRSLAQHFPEQPPQARVTGAQADNVSLAARNPQ
jgi:hypothetical protein